MGKQKYELKVWIRRCSISIAFLWAVTGNYFLLANESPTQDSSCRRVHFTTSEVTESNIDISPNGEWVAFDVLGDLYAVSISGGRATRLTGGNAWDHRPVWSPDGKQIAFVSDGDGDTAAYVATFSGLVPVSDIRKVSDSHSSHQPDGAKGKVAEWMPSGREILFAGVKYSLGGSDDPVTMQSASYYSNGRAIYFADHESGEWGPKFHEIRRWDSTSKNSALFLSRFFALIEPGVESPIVSRDERWIVYRSAIELDEAVRIEPRIAQGKFLPGTDGKKRLSALLAVDLTTLRHKILAAPVISQGWRDNGYRGLGGISGNLRYAITPDSQYLVAGFGGKFHKINLQNGVSSEIPLSVEVEQCLEPILRNEFQATNRRLRIRNLRDARVSPDKTTVAFSALGKIYIRNASSGEIRTLLRRDTGTGQQFMPAYSPDGNWVAFVSWSENTGGHVWRAKIDGTVVERLTDVPRYYQLPTWSPDGVLLAFTGSSDILGERSGFNSQTYGGQVHTYNFKTRKNEVLELPFEAELDGGLSFTENGLRIAFLSHPKLGSVSAPLVTSIALDGSEVREVIPDRFVLGARAVRAVATPSGQVAALSKFGNVYLVSCSSSSERSSEAYQKRICRELKVTANGGYDPGWTGEGDSLEWTFAGVHFRASLKDVLENEENYRETSAEDWLRAQGRLEEIDIEMQVDRRVSESTVALKGATLITMAGNEVIRSGTIVVHGDHILDIGESSRVQIPNNARVFDLSGKTIMPGLVDAHSHFNLPRGIIPHKHWELVTSLSFGITTARDPSNGGDQGLIYGEQIEAGVTLGPRLLGTTTVIPPNFGELKSFSDALSVAKRLKSIGATFLKYHHGQNREQRQWIAKAARATGLNMAAHYAISENGRITPVIDGATTAEHEFYVEKDLFFDVLEFIRQSGVYVDDSGLSRRAGYDCLYWPQFALDTRVEKFYLGNRAPKTTQRCADDTVKNNEGVPTMRPDVTADAKAFSSIANGGDQVMIGSHGTYPGIGMHWEMWAFADGGMSNHQVLRAATLNGANGAGIGGYVGSLERGKVADLLILSKNPLDDIRNTILIESVMKEGVLRKVDTMDELWPASSLSVQAVKGPTDAIGWARWRQ